MCAGGSRAADPAWAEHVLVRLLRRWTACRALEEPVLPSMVAMSRELGTSPEAAVAAASLFELTEAFLGRVLISECCCSRALSEDERAVVILVATIDHAGAHRTSALVPHGLPAVLIWAARSVTLTLGKPMMVRAAVADRKGSAHCPFT